MRIRCISFCATLLLPVVSAAEVFDLPPEGNDVVGAVSVIKARADDTLIDIARRHGLGYEDIVIANPDVDVWLPGEGTEVVLPTRFVLPPGPRNGVVLNLAEYRMYYFPPVQDGETPVVMTYPMSIGRMDWETPLGRTRITAKARNPAWYPPESIRAEHEADGDPLPRVVPPGPDNPLGEHAMRLDLPGYLIHGTNRPAGVGMRVTHGCIRMFPEDIAYLFGRVSVNTPVYLINEPVKMGWDGDELVIEVHRTLASAPPADALLAEVADALLAEGLADVETVAVDSIGGGDENGVTGDALPPPDRNGLTIVTEKFVDVTGERPGELDWDAAEIELARHRGVPVAVGRAIKNAATSAAFE